MSKLKDAIIANRQECGRGFLRIMQHEFGAPTELHEDDEGFTAYYRDKEKPQERFITLRAQYRNSESLHATFEDNTFIRAYLQDTTFSYTSRGINWQWMRNIIPELACKRVRIQSEYHRLRFTQTKNRKRIKEMLAQFIVSTATSVDTMLLLLMFEIAYGNGVPKKELLELWDRIDINIKVAQKIL